MLFRALDIPDGASGREWALWLALAGAVGIAVGALRCAMRAASRCWTRPAPVERRVRIPRAAPVSIEPGIERTDEFMAEGRLLTDVGRHARR